MHFMGLPQVGKSTYLMHLLKSISDNEGKPVLYIPDQTLDLNDLKSIIQTEKYQEIVKKNHLLGLDNFSLQEKTIFPNSTLCIIPGKLGNPYASTFVKPFTNSETLRYIDQLGKVEINPIVGSTIVQYSAGIPILAEKLLDYFVNQKNLSISLILRDNYILKDLNRIYDTFLSQIDSDLQKLWIGLIAVGKPLTSFIKSLNSPIESSSFMLMENLGFNRIVSSPLLLTYLQNRIGQVSINEFKKEGVKQFIAEKQRTSLAIWTANNDLRFFDPNSTAKEIAIHLFKSESLISRLDWNKVWVNGRKVDSPEEQVPFGSEIRFTFGRRDKNHSRTKSYKQLNKEYRKIIFEGDCFSRKNNLEEAEKQYLKIEELKYDKTSRFVPDSNYGKVRLANVYRIEGKLDKAIDICSPIVRSTPNSFAYLCLAICEFWKGNFSRSIELLDNCLVYNPKYVNAILWKARVSMHHKDYNETRLSLGKVIEKKLTDQNRLIFILLNYILAKQTELSGNRSFIWYNKILQHVSNNQRNMIIRQLPLVNMFLQSVKYTEKEFEGIQEKIDTQTFAEGIYIDLFWWRSLIQAH